jgi:aminopeptidase N
MPKLIRANYAPPMFTIDKIDLLFDIYPDYTNVTGTMHFKKQYGEPGMPLVLDGKDITITHMTINGENINLSSIEETKDDDFQIFTISNVPDEGVLVIETRLDPAKNTSGEGLYANKGMYLTQCEATSFRCIMPYIDRPDNLAKFTCEIRANQEKLPVLLSNGNVIGKGNLDNGRHFVKYEDPYAKPSYLFALVGGDLQCIQEQHITKTGRIINLYVYAKPEHFGKLKFSMQALKKVMRWDEEVYGLEYDLDNFYLVASEAFNMGAMENKGLNIFNDRYLLCHPSVSTDYEQQLVEDVIAHEYSHNYAGNRVTVDKWLELALKEGLATRKESDFMKFMYGAAEWRVDEILGLRTSQFPEDASPSAHAVRPDEIDSIDNIYSDTIYLKGAELLAMLSRLVGEDTFTRGVVRYFKDNDGKAVTIEHFIAAQEQESGKNLQQYLRWYTTPGTPKLEITEEYKQETQTYTLHFKQINVSANGTVNPPMLMPIKLGLLNARGKDILNPNTQTLVLSQAEQSFSFTAITERPVPSLLRDFSAPVKVVKTPLSIADKMFLFKYDSDPINRWMVGYELMTQQILTLVKDCQLGYELEVTAELLDALRFIINDSTLSGGMKATMLSLPTVDEIIAESETVDLDNLLKAHKFMTSTLAVELEGFWFNTYHATKTNSDELSAELIGQRRLHNCCLGYLVAIGEPIYISLCEQQYAEAKNMTNRAKAFYELTTSEYPGHEELGALIMDDFYNNWKTEPLAMYKWLAAFALSETADAVDNLRKLMAHQYFDKTIPNHIYKSVRAFSTSNPRVFHRADGAGYKLLADVIIDLNAINPQVASVLIPAFQDWRKFDIARQQLMIAELRRIGATPDLSTASREHVTKMLADAPPVAILRQFAQGSLETMELVTEEATSSNDANQLKM